MRFLVLFLAIYSLLYLGYMKLPDSVLREVVYPLGIGQVCALSINLVAPDEAVRVEGNLVGSSRAALEIVRGCDGIGTLLLVAAAVLAFPASAAKKAMGLMLGFVVVYVINIVRISGLYFVAAHRPDWFLPVHTYFAPTLIIVLCCVFFVLWASHVARTKPADD